MAKKHGKKDDKFLLYTIIGFGVVFVGLIITLVTINATTVSYEYEDFDHLEFFELAATQTDSFYGVYYYATSCAACNSIKPTVLDFAANNTDFPLYFMDAYGMSDLSDKSVIEFDGEGLQYTPTLLVYSNGLLVDMLVGSDSITPFLQEIENGNY
jgi:thiol-disulfide isomerase/thioredoxin